MQNAMPARGKHQPRHSLQRTDNGVGPKHRQTMCLKATTHRPKLACPTELMASPECVQQCKELNQLKNPATANRKWWARPDPTHRPNPTHKPNPTRGTKQDLRERVATQSQSKAGTNTDRAVLQTEAASVSRRAPRQGQHPNPTRKGTPTAARQQSRKQRRLRERHQANKQPTEETPPWMEATHVHPRLPPPTHCGERGH